MQGVIPASDAAALAREKGVDIPTLMSMLLPDAARFAKPPISSFRVGCVSRGLSGALYFGTNLEFAGEALSFTVHAEQSSVTNAWMNGETGIDRLAVTAAPCGYCRQFLNELVTAQQLTISMGEVTQPLTALLPHAFGPRDLGIDGGLLQREDHALAIDSGDDLAQAALAAANMSYAPYSKSYAGVALRTSDGTTATGAYAENAAFNPSMSPLEVALSRLNLAGGAFDAIEDAVLVHVDSLHTEATRVVLRAITRAPLRLVQARNSAQAGRR
ncbi:MAG TPA: cytidine deaminase [Thermoanaerobaculia bacterium]|nr:cytidine deaminase [Thermoanaerobaculia bacterium]